VIVSRRTVRRGIVQTGAIESRVDLIRLSMGVDGRLIDYASEMGSLKSGNQSGLPGLDGGGRSLTKPVSRGSNSLLTGKITGNISIFDGFGRNWV
jgi:hypothetical protein